MLRDHRSHATGATPPRGHDGQVKQGEQEGPSSARQRRADVRRHTTVPNPGVSERIGNSRRTGDIEVVAEGWGSGLTANVNGRRPDERSIRSPQRFTMTDGTNLPTTVSSPESLPVLSVVVPTLNEERCIEAFLERVSRYLESRTLSWEIVVVDDGSGDATVRLVELWIRRDPRVRLLRQAHGGKGSAVRRGISAPRTLDARPELETVRK